MRALRIMPRVLVADDHGLYRKGLRSTLEAALPDLEVSEADSLERSTNRDRTQRQLGSGLDRSEHAWPRIL